MAGRTLGVEEELLILDARTTRPAPEGERVVAEATRAADARASDRAEPAMTGQLEHEFKREQAETGTTPLDDLGAVRDQVVGLRHQLIDAAGATGSLVAAIGTSPFAVRPQQTSSDRYQRMDAEFGLVARQQLICGQHVHVSISSPEEGVGVLDRLRPWLSVITAISANSPFWHGEDTGYASYRSIVWGMWPTAGPTDLFGDVQGYHRVRAALLATGAALDDGMLYFDARLSAQYPTVEIRVADVCADVDDAVLVAALCRGLVETAAAEWAEGIPALEVPLGILRAARWSAARNGLSGVLVDVAQPRTVPAWQMVDALLDHIAPALASYGDDVTVDAAMQRLRRQGTGADLQRMAFGRTQSIAGVAHDAVSRTAAH